MTKARKVDTRLSKSARENGWATYPADVWHRERARLLAHMFWPYCAKKFGGPIVDLCCGNGRYAIALCEKGYEVVGVDVNDGFIERARQWARERAQAGHASNVSFVVGDVVNLDLAKTFKLAILPGWSWQVFLTQEDEVLFLEAVHRHLEPGGAFAFNVFVPFARQRGLVEKDGHYAWPSDPGYHGGTPRSYDPVSQIESMRESNVQEIRLRHTSLSEITLLLRLTGFEIAEMYGDDEDMRPFTGSKGDDYTVLATRK